MPHLAPCRQTASRPSYRKQQDKKPHGANVVEYVDARVVHFTGVVGHGEEPDPGRLSLSPR